jgi:RNA polymerase sigma-70 factor (ECF subfamily)
VPPSDELLVAQAVALGDVVAFETLMRRHQQRIFYLHKRFTRNAALAEELCQETFLRAWRKLGSFAGRGAFAGWLSRLAYNVFLQHRRRNPHDAVTRSLEEPQTAASAAEALATPASAGEEPDLDRLLAVVTPQEQQLLILTYAAGLSATEIGDMLDTSPGTVKSQIHRAKQKIRQHFHLESL